MCLASQDGESELPQFYRLRITDSVASDFRRVVERVLTRRRTAVESGDFALRPYEAGTKLDAHEIEHVDLSANQSIAAQIASLLDVDSLQHFDGDEGVLSGLRFYVVALDSGPGITPTLCFRSTNSKMELSRSRLFGLFLSGNEYDRFDEQMLLFDQHIDCICHGDVLYVFNKNNFQRIFQFFEAVRQAARETLAVIHNSIPISNFAEFEAACEGHLLMLAKLKNIAEKPYLARIRMADIKRVIRAHSLPVRTTKSGGKVQLVFDPSDRWAILRLLDDDYLDSLMTGEKYEVNSKRTQPTR